MTELWTGKIYARDGFTCTNVLGEIVALDIGCGNRRLPGARGVDILSLPAVDVVHDLARFPWPFADSSVDLVLANHFLEHSEDVVRTMEEVYRILSPGGRFVIQVPYFRSVDAINDPTHRRFFLRSRSIISSKVRNCSIIIMLRRVSHGVDSGTDGRTLPEICLSAFAKHLSRSILICTINTSHCFFR